MPAFRRVDAQRAGSRALGILVPPGPNTVVILRPRSLDWDLLPARWEGEPSAAPVFSQFSREEAPQVARRLQLALEQAVAGATNPVETFGNPLTRQFQVWVHTREFVWIVCRRLPGQPYEPVVFQARDEAESAARHLQPFFFPAPDADQQYYFNTQNFTRAG
jgi:hypothetical protein